MQREYGCGHYKFIAAEWCQAYAQTHRRCAPNVTHFEYRYAVLPILPSLDLPSPSRAPPLTNARRRANELCSRFFYFFALGFLVFLFSSHRSGASPVVAAVLPVPTNSMPLGLRPPGGFPSGRRGIARSGNAAST